MFPGTCPCFLPCPAVLTKLSTAARAPCAFILVPSFSVLPPPLQLSPSPGPQVSPACLHLWLGSFCWGSSGPERRGQAGPPLGQGGDAGRRMHSTGPFGGLQAWGRSGRCWGSTGRLVWCWWRCPEPRGPGGDALGWGPLCLGQGAPASSAQLRAAGAPAPGGGLQPPFTQISARGKKNKALYFSVIKTKRGAAAKPQPERCPRREPKAVEFAPGGSER